MSEEVPPLSDGKSAVGSAGMSLDAVGGEDVPNDRGTGLGRAGNAGRKTFNETSAVAAACGFHGAYLPASHAVQVASSTSSISW